MNENIKKNNVNNIRLKWNHNTAIPYIPLPTIICVFKSFNVNILLIIFLIESLIFYYLHET